MRPGHAELAGDLRRLRCACSPPANLHAGVHHVLLGAVEAPEKIEMPPGAAEFAVGDRLQADLFLLLDDALDLAILDLLQLRPRVISPLAFLRARLVDRLRAQQAADMVGAERALVSLIGVVSSSSIAGAIARAQQASRFAPATTCRATMTDQRLCVPVNSFRTIFVPSTIAFILAKADRARQIFQSAIGRDHQPLGRHHLQRLADAIGHSLAAARP